MMNEQINNRKGARKVQDIPKEVLDLLNKGNIETVNLTEWLAVNHIELIKANFVDIGIPGDGIQKVLDEVRKQKKPSVMNTIKVVGESIYRHLNGRAEFLAVFEKLKAHKSDSIRCYTPYLVSLNDESDIEEKLNEVKDLIADRHFGVREVVWMALRPEIAKDLEKSIRILTEWTTHEHEYIRRFTTESTRPRGVWCKHIDKLKENPEVALPILENLKSDSSKYVQDSVGNWLNDASKSRPDFVIELCDRWKKESPVKETEKIIKKARRTIDK